MGKSLIVTIRKSEGGGLYEFTPEDNDVFFERVVFFVGDHGELNIRKRRGNRESSLWDEPETIRVFAAGVWADVEVVE